jgi:hypothetical protein
MLYRVSKASFYVYICSLLDLYIYKKSKGYNLSLIASKVQPDVPGAMRWTLFMN